MKFPRSHIVDTIFMLALVLAILGFFFPGFLMRIIFESGYPFYIKLIGAFVLLLGVLFALIILVDIIMPLFRKKSKGNTKDREE